MRDASQRGSSNGPKEPSTASVPTGLDAVSSVHSRTCDGYLTSETAESSEIIAES